MKRGKLLIVLILFGNNCIGQDKKNDEHNICSERICVDGMQELEGGFLISPIEIDKIDKDSNDTLISSNTVLVRFKKGAYVNNIVNSVRGKVSAYIPELNVYELRFDFDSAKEVEDKITELRNFDEIDLAEKNYVFESEDLDIERQDGMVPDDKWQGTWGFFDVKLVEAYRYIEENNIDLHPVTVAILDSGIMNGHTDFNSDQIVWEYDFAEAKTEVETLDPHGLEVAGIAAADNGNGGINGIAPFARIFDFKIYYGEDKRFLARTLIMAIEAAVKKGAKVINISAGMYSKKGFESLDFLRGAATNNVVIVSSAGNGDGEFDCTNSLWLEHCNIGDDASNHYPSAFREVISVGAIDQIGARTLFSNYSKDDNEDVLTLAAPGDKVILLTANNLYTIDSGTSYATPFVSGLAALLKSIKPALTADEVRQIMIDSADEIVVSYPDQSGHTWRRINVYEAVKKVVEEQEGNNAADIIGKPCFENEECAEGIFCNFGFCTVSCYSNNESEEKLPVSCDDCNLFWICPDGTICESLRDPYGLENNILPFRNCYKSCNSSNNCGRGFVCLMRNSSSGGICIIKMLSGDMGEDSICGEIYEGFEEIKCEQGLQCYKKEEWDNVGYCIRN